MREVQSIVTLWLIALAGCEYTHGVVAADGAVFPPDAIDAAVRARVSLGLAALWRFDEGSGSTISDDGPFAMPVTITVSSGFTWGTGKLTFDQPSRSNTAPNPPIDRRVATTGEVTLEAWVSASEYQGEGTVMSQPNYAAIVTVSPNIGVRNVALVQTGDTWTARMRTTTTTINGDPAISSPAGAVALDTPTHLVIVSSSSERTFYVNGVPYTSSPAANGSTSGWDYAYRIIFGDENDPYSRPWLGTLWLVAMYDRALTSDEVTQNFEAGPDCDGC